MLRSCDGSQTQFNIVTLSVAFIMLSGCDRSVPSWPPADSYSTIFDSHTVIPEESLTVAMSNASVVGSVANVCLALGSGTPAPHSSQQLRAEIGQFLGESNVSVLVTTSTGEQKQLCGPSRGWRADGRFGGKNELSVCYQTNCSNEPMELGVEISSVTLSASPPLDVLGGYWESTNGFDTN